MEKGYIRHELAAHLPFSIFFTAAGVVLAALLTYVSLLTEPQPAPLAEHGHAHESALDDGHNHEAEADRPHLDADETQHAASTSCDDHDEHAHGHPASSRFQYASQMMFHIFHPIHLLLSGMATAAMFFRYDRSVWKAVIVGFVGALGVCVLSDIFLPYLSGLALRPGDIHFHVCLIEHPQMVIPFAAIGIVTGILASGAIRGSTILAHSSHVFVSSAASLFYLVSFGISDWFAPNLMAPVFILVIVCVTAPCCISDIVFPLLLANKNGRASCAGHHHHAPEPKT